MICVKTRKVAFLVYVGVSGGCSRDDAAAADKDAFAATRFHDNAFQPACFRFSLEKMCLVHNQRKTSS